MAETERTGSTTQRRHGASIGQPLTRRDGLLKVTGQACYAADHREYQFGRRDPLNRHCFADPASLTRQIHGFGDPLHVTDMETTIVHR